MAKQSGRSDGLPEVAPAGRNETTELFSGPLWNLKVKPLLQAWLIVASAFWIYAPALHGDWLWDDGQLITQNALVHAPAGLWKIWFDPGSLVDYFPLKVSVEWLEWHLWAMNTFGYHVTSVLLHVGSALPFWRLLGKFGFRLA